MGAAAAEGYCLRKLSVGAIAAALLLPNSCTPALNVGNALTVRLLPLLVPKMLFPLEVRRLATLTVLLAVTGAAKFTGAVAAKVVGEAKMAPALMLTVSELVIPSMLLLLAVKVPAVAKVLATVTGALNCATAFAVKVFALLDPSTVLPTAVRVLLLLFTVTFAAKVVAALTVTVFVLVLPNTALPAAVK